jgi:HEAT repeat protein
MAECGRRRGIRLRTLLFAVAVCAFVCALAVQIHRSLSPVRRSASQMQAASSASARCGAVSIVSDPNWLPPWEQEEAYRILVAALDDPDAIVRSSAAMALTRRRDHAAEVVSLVLGLMKDKHPRVRERALFALESFRPRGSTEVDAIVAAAILALDDPNPEVRLEAGRALHVFGQDLRSVPAMVRLVREEKGNLRLGALCWLELAKSIPKDLEPILREMVKSDNVTERISGRQALFRLAIPAHERDAMIDAALKSPFDVERIDAAYWMIKLRKRDRAIPVLQQIAASADKALAARAERMLYELEGPDADAR